MAKLLTPKLLRRGFEIFLLVSLLAFGALLLYGNNLEAFLSSLGNIHVGWLLAGLVLASMDWLGGGVRNWLIVRHVHDDPPFWGMVLAGGMSAWASYVTPLQSGAGPMMMYGMKRAGVPVPKAVTSTLMTFISTVAFFAIAGPLAIFFGAGKSLGEHGVVLGLSLYDLFLGSLGVFAALGVLLLVVMVSPRFIMRGLHTLAEMIGRRSTRVAARLETLREGIDQAHESMRAFNTPGGWLALFWATLASGPSHANKLLSGYVTLRTIGIHAPFVDVLLLQTLIMFLLYFAPTPGASGIAEIISAAVMSIYVPRTLVPIYTLLWRLVLSYYTIGFGFIVFSGWVRKGLKGIEQEPLVSSA